MFYIPTVISSLLICLTHCPQFSLSLFLSAFQLSILFYASDGKLFFLFLQLNSLILISTLYLGRHQECAYVGRMDRKPSLHQMTDYTRCQFSTLVIYQPINRSLMCHFKESIRRQTWKMQTENTVQLLVLPKYILGTPLLYPFSGNSQNSQIVT